VFRRPDHPLLLCVLVGTGVSLFIEILIGCALYCIGGKYALGSLFVFHSVFAACNGFIASQLFVLFHGTDWGFLIAASAFTAPAFLLSTFFVL